jgi:hypothetical protein
MGFGAIITSGDNDTVLGDDLMRWLVEARVEQELSAPTRFALRFEDDSCEGSFEVLKAKEIKPNAVMGIVAPSGNKLVCLVRGPVTQVRFAVMLGAAGSWVEIHGEDRRVEMDRLCVQAVWNGVLASDAATKILDAYHLNPQVEATTKQYSDKGHTLNQRGTDLAFIEQIGRENGYELWIEYDDIAKPDTKAGTPLNISETTKLQPSPPRNGGLAPPILLAPPNAPFLRVNVPPEDCPNVTSFQIDTDTERANSSGGLAVNPRTGKLERTQVINPQPGLDGGPTLKQIDGVTRTICVTSAGGTDELEAKQKAALVEAGWFVEATASTTAHMLGSVLKPHDIVPVEGIGAELSGPYQVQSVTHVINAADHFMDIKLRSNIGSRT